MSVSFYAKNETNNINLDVNFANGRFKTMMDMLGLIDDPDDLWCGELPIEQFEIALDITSGLDPDWTISQHTTEDVKDGNFFTQGITDDYLERRMNDVRRAIQLARVNNMTHIYWG